MTTLLCDLETQILRNREALRHELSTHPDCDQRRWAEQLDELVRLCERITVPAGHLSTETRTSVRLNGQVSAADTVINAAAAENTPKPVR
jgi:hypothetical protein